jgi:pimeloyl-ACP methyl ester carboxylesterase
MMYAGVRPQRIEHLVNLEGFGLPETRPAQAAGRYAQWMDEIKAVQRGGKALKSYADADGVARRLMKTNPRLAQDKADWLARQWSAPNAQGEWEILGDAAHKVTSAHIYRLDEALEIYRRISAPVLSVTASDDSLGQWWKGSYTLAQFEERIRAVPRLQSAVVQEAGHMVHHDQPAELAHLIETFLNTAP